MSSAPTPQADRRAATRTRLLDAAAKVFAERGFQAASVSEVAREAGLSVGAVYSNFAGKEELFVALTEEHLDWLGGVLERGASADTGADAWMAYLEDNRERFLLFIEFWAYAMRNPEFRPTFARQLARTRELLAERIGPGLGEAGDEVGDGAGNEAGGEAGGEAGDQTGDEARGEAGMLALAATVLARGVALEKLVDPDGVPDDAFARLLARLL